IKTAALATGRPRVLAFHGGYHGLTLGGLSVSGRSDFRAPFHAQFQENAVFLSYPRSGGARETDQVDAALAAVERALDENGDVGAVLLEPIQGRGGDLVPPDGWLQGLRMITSERGILLILDEIYTGFGRTGRWFACEHWDVVPDLMAVGKALTGGLPF